MGKGEGENMQLEHINPEQWATITDAVIWLWIVVALVILFNGSLLFGRAVFPSLAQTRSDPTGPEKMVPLFAVFGGAALFGVLIAAYTFADNVEVIYDVFERVWY